MLHSFSGPRNKRLLILIGIALGFLLAVLAAIAWLFHTGKQQGREETLQVQEDPAPETFAPVEDENAAFYDEGDEESEDSEEADDEWDDDESSDEELDDDESFDDDEEYSDNEMDSSTDEESTAKPEQSATFGQVQDRSRYPLVPDDFPIYSQLDFPGVRYGTGTVENNGCGITALAMVATYMTGHEYTPADLARYFGSSAENTVDRISIASRKMKLKWHMAENWIFVKEALAQGKIVIQMVNRKSRFTTNQHFLVLVGYTSDGKIIAIDPNPKNYLKWNLKKGFQEGFLESDIVCGYDGAWIYDPAAMPEDPFIYEPPERPYVEPRYTDLDLSEADIDLLARLVWVEARGESMEGQQAVAEVVLNRMMSDRFANTMSGVVNNEEQFVSQRLLRRAEPSQTQYEAIENAILGPYILPTDVFFYARWPNVSHVWGRIGGHCFYYG